MQREAALLHWPKGSLHAVQRSQLAVHGMDAERYQQRANTISPDVHLPIPDIAQFAFSILHFHFQWKGVGASIAFVWRL